MDVNVNLVQALEAIGGIGGIGAIAKWGLARLQRMERENALARQECRDENAALRKEIAEVSKRSFDSAVADRTVLTETLLKNTAAVDRNSNVLEKFSSVLINRTPPNGNIIQH